MKATINIEFTDDELRKYAEDVGRRWASSFFQEAFKTGKRLEIQPGFLDGIKEVLASALSSKPQPVAESAQWSSRTTCEPIEGPGLEPGWACCSCSVYNGRQRVMCKNCGHVRCDAAPAPPPAGSTPSGVKVQ